MPEYPSGHVMTALRSVANVLGVDGPQMLVSSSNDRIAKMCVERILEMEKRANRVPIGGGTHDVECPKAINHSRRCTCHLRAAYSTPPETNATRQELATRILLALLASDPSREPWHAVQTAFKYADLVLEGVP